MASECVFCDLIVDDAGEWVATEERAVAFLPLPGSEIAPGHTLVVPRRHCEAGVLDAPWAGALTTCTSTSSHAIPGDGDDCLPWPVGRSPHVLAGDPRELLSRALL